MQICDSNFKRLAMFNVDKDDEPSYTSGGRCKLAHSFQKHFTNIEYMCTEYILSPLHIHENQERWRTFLAILFGIFRKETSLIHQF